MWDADTDTYSEKADYCFQALQPFYVKNRKCSVHMKFIT